MKKHNTKNFMLFTIIVMSITILFAGCNKTTLKASKSDLNQNITVANGMLKFNSLSAFNNTIKDIKANPSVDPKVILNRILGDHQYNRFANKLKAGAAPPAKDTIVQDQAYSSILNNKGEVQVNNSRYRITPYGTFLYKPENEDKVNQLTTALQQKKPIEEAEVQPYFYKDGNGIYRYATLKQARNNTVVYSSNNSELNTNQDIKTYVFTGSKTVVGNLISKYDFRACYKRYFEPHRRIKVVFSSSNFLLFAYINAKMKFQLKNLIGWSKTKCNKMALGWDGIAFKYNKSIPTPQNPKPYSNSWNNYDNWEYADYKPLSSSTTYFTFIIPYFNKEVNFTSNDVAKMFKAGFDWLKGKLDPTIKNKPNINLAVMTSTNNQPSNLNEIIIGPKKITKENVKKISHTFNSESAIITFTNNLAGDSHLNITPASGYKIIYASVYGMAYYNNKWLGIRIVKNK